MTPCAYSGRGRKWAGLSFSAVMHYTLIVSEMSLNNDDIPIKLCKKKSLCNDKSEILKWVSEICGTEIRSLQQLWDIGPNALGKYMEPMNNQDATWWALQDLARSTFAVPQVMSRQEMGRRHLRGNAEKKFLRLMLRVKEALERSSGANSTRVSGDLVAKGVALSAAYVEMRGVFFIYSYRNQLESVQIEMTGPGNVKVETKQRRDGLMVGYTVDKSGMYVLEISKNNWFVPGSPFQVNVQDPPVGYKGNFGSDLWDKPETQEYQVAAIPEPLSQPSSLQWEPEEYYQTPAKPSPKGFPSRPKKTKKSNEKQPVVELSHIAAAIILARRFTNRMQTRVPELRLERTTDQQTELNLWSNAASSPPLREITYVSPEGATFPISVANRSDDGTPKKWNEHSNQSLEDWLLGRTTAELSRGSGSFVCPSDQNLFPKSRHSAATCRRRSPNNVRPVRPFNQSSSVTISSGSDSESMKRREDGRVWTHCASIGVNTDESWMNTTPGSSEPKKEYKSQGLQVGRSFTSWESTESFRNNLHETKAVPGACSGTNYGPLLKEQSSQDAVLPRARKCDTFNSDDTTSSVTTNYSEKIIEMDLKVQYETIALTSTDEEYSRLESARREADRGKRRFFHHDLSSFDNSFVKSEVFGKRSDFSATTKPNPGLVKRQSVDGIYKATLMNTDCSPIKSDFFRSEDTMAGDSSTGQSIRRALYSKNGNERDEGRPKSESERSASYIDELQQPKSGYDLSSNLQEQNRSRYYCTTTTSRIELVRQFAMNHIATEYNPKITTKKMEQKRLGQLMKKKWASKIPSRRVVKPGSSGSCKKHLRKTLSLLPMLGDEDGESVTGSCPLYSFGPYPVKKDVVKIQTPVRAWKRFWDNIANSRPEAVLRRDCSIKSKGLVKRGKSALEKLSQETKESPDAAQDDDRKRSIVQIECNVVCIDETLESVGSNKRILSGKWKSRFHHTQVISTVDMLANRFETAKQLFTQLEKDTHNSLTVKTKSSDGKRSDSLNKLQPHWDLKNLFQDFSQGLGKPGVVNRLGVLASLHSVAPVFHIGGYESQYPHLPVSGSSRKPSVVPCTQRDTRRHCLEYAFTND